MSDYTHMNLKDDVENASEKFGLAPNMEAHFGRNALLGENHGFHPETLSIQFSFSPDRQSTIAVQQSEQFAFSSEADKSGAMIDVLQNRTGDMIGGTNFQCHSTLADRREGFQSFDMKAFQRNFQAIQPCPGQNDPFQGSGFPEFIQPGWDVAPHFLHHEIRTHP